METTMTKRYRPVTMKGLLMKKGREGTCNIRRNDDHGGDHVPANKTAAAKKRKVDQLVAPVVASKVKGSAAGKQAGTKRKVRDDEGCAEVATGSRRNMGRKGKKVRL